jgi:hypothetical protein
MTSNPLVAVAGSGRSRDKAREQATRAGYGACSVRILSGRRAILAAQPQLAALARTTSQTGEADSLAYFLSTPDAVKKTPHLLLIEDASAPAGGLSAAVFLFEYKTPLGGTRVFATEDGMGRRDVLAPPELRARYAAVAARTLVERGAHIVLISFCEVHRDRACSPAELSHPGFALQTIAAELSRDTSRRRSAQWSLLEQHLPAYLPLLPTFDETLARIGQKTRANLRYYRRRCELEHGCSFVPEATLSLAEFLAFNRECSFAVDDSVACFRYRMLTTQSHFRLCGVRDGNGRWLSLAGMRRQNGFVEIDWQMNRADLPQASLATVLRSYLLEHEIGLGSTRLYIEGGTPQPLGHSFVRQRVAELTVKRDSAYVRLLERFGKTIFPPKNYIGYTLRNAGLHWRPW